MESSSTVRNENFVLTVNKVDYKVSKKLWDQVQQVRCTYQPLSQHLIQIAEKCSKNNIFGAETTRNIFVNTTSKNVTAEIFISVKNRKPEVLGRMFHFEYKGVKGLGMKVEVRSVCKSVWVLDVLTKKSISNDSLQKESLQSQYMIYSVVEILEWMSFFSSLHDSFTHDDIIDKRYLCFIYNEPVRKSRNKIVLSDNAIELPFRDFLLKSCGWKIASPTLCKSIPDIIKGSCIFEIPAVFFKDNQ